MNILITGVSKGLGLITETLLKQGHNVYALVGVKAMNSKN